MTLGQPACARTAVSAHRRAPRPASLSRPLEAGTPQRSPPPGQGEARAVGPPGPRHSAKRLLGRARGTDVRRHI